MNTFASTRLTSAPLNSDELKKLGVLVKQRAVEFTAAAGTLQFRGNAVVRIAVDDTSLAAIRKALQAGKGAVPVWASAHFTDNIIGQDGNHFTALHLSLSTTHFVAVGTDLGMAGARTVIYMGNTANSDARLFSTSAIAPAQAANLGPIIVVL